MLLDQHAGDLSQEALASPEPDVTPDNHHEPSVSVSYRGWVRSKPFRLRLRNDESSPARGETSDVQDVGREAQVQQGELERTVEVTLGQARAYTHTIKRTVFSTSLESQVRKLVVD